MSTDIIIRFSVFCPLLVEVFALTTLTCFNARGCNKKGNPCLHGCEVPHFSEN